MNKRELVDAIADRVGDRKTATEAVNAMLEAIQNAVASGDKVSITGFGAFEMVHKPARTARNPSTGAPIDVSESWQPRFRPGADFKEMVNAGGKKAAQKR
jgi:DNA-binding protein HU-beta